MKILYLHGLDSLLQDDRREVLSRYGTVLGPTLDYANTPGLFEQLANDHHDIDAIIGSSAGGLVGYYLAQTLHKPCLLFNPAISFRSQMPVPTDFDILYDAYMQIVIGLQDEVLPPQTTLDLILSDLTPSQNTEIHLINKLAHPLPIAIFSKETELFINRIKNKS
ncbi:MAG: YqiA/YcfP family alpha/beta fold hydrolase [Capnocytophaga sp.]|nr:YqiA/YcfP family alpha/beta fold hydrolase [Capnocytophaga sp.]